MSREGHRETWETCLSGLRLGRNLADSPRTLLLHGFAGTAADWTSCWTGDEPALALDLPGHGASEDPRGDWDAAIGRLLAALPASVDRVVGYELGGRIALGMLRAAPARLGSVTVVSAHPGVSHPAERAVRRATDRCWVELIRRDGVAGLICARETVPRAQGQARWSLEALARRRARRLTHRADGLIASLEVFGLAKMPDTREDLRRFTGELRWIVGAEDRASAAIAREVSELRPQTELHRLSGVGCNVLCDAPRELAALLDR